MKNILLEIRKMYRVHSQFAAHCQLYYKSTQEVSPHEFRLLAEVGINVKIVQLLTYFAVDMLPYKPEKVRHRSIIWWASHLYIEVKLFCKLMILQPWGYVALLAFCLIFYLRLFFQKLKQHLQPTESWCPCEPEYHKEFYSNKVKYKNRSLKDLLFYNLFGHYRTKDSVLSLSMPELDHLRKSWQKLYVQE